MEENLIYDRTLEDVEYAKAHPDSTEFLKGAFNFTDLNRIELWTIYCNSLLAEIGIDVEITPVKTFAVRTYNDLSNYTYDDLSDLNYTAVLYSGGWSKYDTPTLQQINQIRQNIDNMKEAFNIGNDLEIEYTNYINYEQLNILEKILQEIKNNVDNITRGYVFSGTFNCGEQLIR